jgi:hypothetical protein
VGSARRLPFDESTATGRASVFAGLRPELALLVLCLMLGPRPMPARALPAVDAERAIEFWIVEPNEGDSAGGHAALRIGERLYHVEHRGDGLIADRRTPRARFEEIYRVRGNRAITRIPLALEHSGIQRLEDTLEQRHFERNGRLDAVDSLVERSEFLARAQARGYLAIDVPGLGLYERGPSSCGRQHDASAAFVLREIERRYGRSWLFARRDRARAVAASRLAAVVALEDEGAEASGPGGPLRRLREAVGTWAALEMLGDCRRVRSDRIRLAEPDFDPDDDDEIADDDMAVEPDDRSTPLDRSAARARWRQARDEQRERFVQLLASDREDRGLALLLARARLEALDRSLTTGRLHVLDPQAEGEDEDGKAATLAESLPAAWMPLVEARVRERVRVERRAFERGSGPLEARIAGLERAVNEARHVARRSRHRPPKPASPSASYATHYVAAERVLPWPDGLALGQLARARALSERRAARLRAELAPALEYRLFTRNCVTEMLGAMALLGDTPARPTRDPALASHEAAAADVLRGRFIPVVAGRYVTERLSSGAPRRLESARETLLRDLETRRPRARWREAMTLTARTYRPHAADSSFLFFTDGPIWLRPLAGLTNLAYGFGAAGLGVLAMPFDAGRQLRRGLLGAMMSVPELFFFQVRQGSYPVSPPIPTVEAPSPRSDPGSVSRFESSSGSTSTR